MENDTDLRSRRESTALKRWMTRTGTSGVQLAAKLGVSSTAVYKWASRGEGRPTYERAVELSNITGIPVAELMRAPSN